MLYKLYIFATDPVRLFDQAINEIRQKYEMEKVESINLEKEKVCWLFFISFLIIILCKCVFHKFHVQADKLVGEMKKKCEQQLVECKEESRQYLLRVREEHAVLVCSETQFERLDYFPYKKLVVNNIGLSQFMPE